MTKKLLILSLLTCFNSFLFAQLPTLAWAKKSGGSGGEGYRNSVTDNSGNVYTCGSFSSPTFQLGTTTLTNAGTSGYDVFVVKYDPSGNVLWAKSAGGTAYDYIEYISVDDNGNVYIAGSFSSSVIDFGGTLLSNAQIGQRDAYLAKYDQNGNLGFVKLISGTKTEQVYNVNVDVNNDIYFTCSYSSPIVSVGTMNFDNANTSGNSSDDILLVKCDSGGDIIWAESFGGMEYDKCFGLTSDNEGNVYISGTIGSTSIDFGSSVVIDNGHTGGADFYIAKFDSSGTALWAETHGGYSTDVLYSLVVTDGHVYGTGYFDSGFLAFGADTLFNHDVGSSDFFIVKYDLDGNLMWKLSEGGDQFDSAYGIAADSHGDIYVTGNFQSLTVDLGDTSITGNGSDVFLLKYSSDGIIDWALSYVSSSYDGGYGVAVDQFDNIYLSGYFSETIDFDPGSGIVNLIASDIDAFILKFNGELSKVENLYLTSEISPNPTKDYVHLSLGNYEQNFSYKLMTLSGQIVTEKSKLAGKEITIDISSQLSGIYLLEIEIGGKKELFKIIKD